MPTTGSSARANSPSDNGRPVAPLFVEISSNSASQRHPWGGRRSHRGRLLPKNASEYFRPVAAAGVCDDRVTGYASSGHSFTHPHHRRCFSIPVPASSRLSAFSLLTVWKRSRQTQTRNFSLSLLNAEAVSAITGRRLPDGHAPCSLFPLFEEREIGPKVFEGGTRSAQRRTDRPCR